MFTFMSQGYGPVALVFKTPIRSPVTEVIERPTKTGDEPKLLATMELSYIILTLPFLNLGMYPKLRNSFITVYFISDESI